MEIIKTSPQQVAIIDNSANVRSNLDAGLLAAVHEVIRFSALRRRPRSQCRSGTPVLEISLLLCLPSPSLCFFKG